MNTNTQKPTFRVVKIGGSLFSLDDLKSRLEQYLHRLPVKPTVLIAGGGVFVENIREWDSRFGLGDELAHQISCKQLSITARLVADLLEIDQIVTKISELKDADVSDPNLFFIVFDPSQWSLDQPDLAQSWNVTSDSISAALAHKLNADELILIKSTIPTDNSIASVSSEGVADPCFETISKGLKTVRCVNLLVVPPETIVLMEN